MRAGVWSQRVFIFGPNGEQIKKVYGGYKIKTSKSQKIFSEPTLEELIHTPSMGRG